MLKQVLIGLVAVLAFEARLASAVLGGDITVTVKGEDGTSVAGASVLVERILAPGVPQAVGWKQRTEWNATTSSAGVFRLSGLPYGRYAFCVQAPATPWLNPCEWESTRPDLEISAIQRSVSKTIVLKRGASILIRVNDPAKLLPQNEGRTAGAHLLLGVGTPKLMFHLASMRSEDASGRNYEVIIPFDVETDLAVASPFFRLKDANGMALPSVGASSVRLRALAGREPPRLVFSVDGHR